jgi:hypothetical protein
MTDETPGFDPEGTLLLMPSAHGRGLIRTVHGPDFQAKASTIMIPGIWARGDWIDPAGFYVNEGYESDDPGMTEILIPWTNVQCFQAERIEDEVVRSFPTEEQEAPKQQGRVVRPPFAN